MSTTDEVTMTAVVYAEHYAETQGVDPTQEESEAWLLFVDNNYDEDEFTVEQWDEIRMNHERDYRGIHDSFAEFVVQLADEMWDIPLELQGYIDYDSMESDFSMDYECHAGAFGVHIWSN